MGAASSTMWEWENGEYGSERWHAFDDATQAQLEAAFTANEEKIELNQGYFANSDSTYVMNFELSMQVNMDTQFFRRVRRNGQNLVDVRMAASDAESHDISLDEEAAVVQVLFSPACATEREGTTYDYTSIKPLTQKQVVAVLREHVSGIDSMLDRLQQVCVTDYIWKTYQSGLPSLSASPIVLEHSKNSLRFIFDKVPDLPAAQQRSYLKMLAEAYQSCQAEQARVLDYIFGLVSGRDRGFKDQVLVLLDTVKQSTLDLVCVELNPKAGSAGDGDPTKQLPHIQ